jgi:hypothetical protein
VVLGTYPGTEDASFAIKMEPDWTAIWAITPALPPEWYRTIARYAGVHIYDEANDVLDVNESFLTITAASSGRHRITLPEARDVYDALTGQLVAQPVSKIDLDMKLGETKLLLQRRDAGASTPELR